jgi:hypothetical protein
MGGTKEAALNPGGRGGAPATSVLRFAFLRRLKPRQPLEVPAEGFSFAADEW